MDPSNRPTCPIAYAELVGGRDRGDFAHLPGLLEDPATRDLATLIYPEGNPANLLPKGDRDRALPLFDALDAFNAMQFLGARGLNLPKLNETQRTFLKEVLANRGYGQYGWEEWSNDRNPDNIRAQLKARGIEIDLGEIDRAIAYATSMEVRPGLRVIPAKKRGEKGYVDPENIPNGPTLVIRSNPDVMADGLGEVVRGEVTRLLKRPKGAKVAEGTVFLADIHVGRPGGEEANFLKVIDALSENPPKRLVFGGDLIDAPAFGRQMARINQALEGLKNIRRTDVAAREVVLKGLSEGDRKLLTRVENLRLARGKRRGVPIRDGEPLIPGEIELLRRFRFVELLGQVREKLPDTKVVFQFGNHDLPRRTQLEARTGQGQGDRVILGVRFASVHVPRIPLTSRGQLPETWVGDFRGAFRRQLDRMVDPAQREKVLSQFDKYSDKDVVELASQFFIVKGQSDRIEEMSQFPYYWEGAGKRLQAALEEMGIEVTGVRSDKYFAIEVGEGESQVLMAHEPQENGPNINRIYSEKPSVVGGQSRFPDSARAVIAFDQHTSGTIVMDVNGKPVSVHMVGSLTPNSNAGQKLMAAVMDPKTGRLYHITFDNGYGEVGPPRRSDYRQIQYVQPTLNENRPASLSSTTGRK